MLLLFLIIELNKLVKKLDKKQKKMCKTGNFTSKPKLSSTASALSPPRAAPQWAGKSSFVKKAKTLPPIEDSCSISSDTSSTSCSESDSE